MNKYFAVGTTCAIALSASTLALTFPEQEQLPVDPANLTPQQQRYCEGVKQWRMQEMLDVEARMRSGQPDIKGTYDQWCAGL